MVRARIDGSPLTAAAGLIWNGDLPSQLQHVLFDTAGSIVCLLATTLLFLAVGQNIRYWHVAH